MGSRRKLTAASAVSVVAAAALYGAPAAPADDVCVECVIGGDLTGQANAFQKIQANPAIDAFQKLRESPALVKLQDNFSKGEVLPFPFQKLGPGA